MADFSATSALQFCSVLVSLVAVAKLKFVQGPYKAALKSGQISFSLCSLQNVSKVSGSDNETFSH